MLRSARFKLLALLALLAVVAAACGGGDSDDAGGSAQGGSETEAAGGSEDSEAPEATGSEADSEGGEAASGEGETLVFATSNEPVVLDGALVSDGESLRVIDQIFEGLVTLEAGSTEVAPLLAESWEPNEDGTSWTFQLREGVTFHDGTEFNAEAVCFNFDRWYNFSGSFQNPDATYYWQTVFGGFANVEPEFAESVPETSLYESCEAVSPTEVVINLTRNSASFIPSLALTNFTIASPQALEEFNADEGEVDAEGVFRATGTFGTEHPIGTGPYQLESFERGRRIVLTRYPDYWGDAEGNVEELIFQPISDNAARLQALQGGEIQGYDLVDPLDLETIESDENLQLLNRPAFNVGYIGFNQAIPPLDDIEVRRAIAHAINREEIVTAFYPEGAEVATQFMPPSLFGYAEDVTTYEYDPEMSRQILEDAGYTLPVPIRFAYPTEVSRPYMPDPEANFEAMRADLDAAGFAVEPVSAVWSPDYLSGVNTGQYPLYLLGWTGDFGDPDNFIGTFFQEPQPAWGFDNPAIFEALDAAEAETDEETRTELYEEANRLIMDDLPGLPYVHTEPALAFTSDVEGYTPSPVSLEPFSPVTVGGN